MRQPPPQRRVFPLCGEACKASAEGLAMLLWRARQPHRSETAGLVVAGFSGSD